VDEDFDCDGVTDEICEDGTPCTLYYEDYDADGFGGEVAACRCEPVWPETLVAGDCDDFDPSIYPGAFDHVYDGVDADCGGEDDYDYDRDGYVADEFVGLYTYGVPGSGSLPGGDCDDSDPFVNPAPATNEDCSTPYDDDCDGDTNDEDAIGSSEYFADRDEDTHGDPGDSKWFCAPKYEYSALSGDDCDDEDPVSTTLDEDADCNGVLDTEEGCVDGIDNDADGWIDMADPDCETEPEMGETGYSGATQCNDGVDNDLDGFTDAADPHCTDASDNSEAY